MLILCLMTLLPLCLCSLFDPHLFPSQGPFFEGWYFRFIDVKEDFSFGILFGKVLPQDVSVASKPWFMGIIIDGIPNHASSGKLIDYNCFPPPNKASITVEGGKSVSKNPDTESPPYFEFETGDCGFVRTKPNGTNVHVIVGGIKLEADIGEPRPWSEDQLGPMGWLTRLPLPLFWFVYSTGSLANYRLALDDGRIISGQALTHMEKNWGDSFPAAWTWLQGVQLPGTLSNANPSPKNQEFASFAVTYGTVNFHVGNVPSHLAGYRNKAKNIAVDFRSDKSISSVTLDPCKGQMFVTLTSLLYKMELVSTATQSTFSDCLYGPMRNGFRQVCKESFRASATVGIYRRNWFSWAKIDSQTFELSALEFGGSFTCNQTCVGNE